MRFATPKKGGTAAEAGQLHLLFDTAKSEFTGMSAQQRRDAAKSMIHYYFTTRTVFRDLNDTHGVSPTFDPPNAAGKILNRVADELTNAKAVPDKDTELGEDDSKNVNPITKILRSDRNWSGMARGSEVFVNLFHSTEADVDRSNRWKFFQTLIHEYLHTLSNIDYDTYAGSFGGSDAVEHNTLIEGMDSVLDEVVWAHVLPRTKHPDLRRVVEGEVYSKLPPMEVPAPRRYPSYTEALALVEKVGIQNVYAAYFLGLVDRISVSLPVPKKTKSGAKP
jgi:hypothetical protein